MDDPTRLIVTSGQVGSMSNTNALTRSEHRPPGRHRSFKNAAIALWGIAFLSAILRAEYAENIRVLALIGGLLVIDVGFALLLTLLAYMETNRTEEHVIGDYSYRCGWRDCEAKHRSAPALHVVEAPRHAEDYRFPEMRRTGDRMN